MKIVEDPIKQKERLIIKNFFLKLITDDFDNEVIPYFKMRYPEIELTRTNMDLLREAFNSRKDNPLYGNNKHHKDLRESITISNLQKFRYNLYTPQEIDEKRREEKLKIAREREQSRIKLENQQMKEREDKLKLLEEQEKARVDKIISKRVLKKGVK